jgi:hypothetical protein
MRLSIGIAIVVAIAALAADTLPSPKSPVALAAMNKADLAEKAALEAFDKSLFKIKRNEADELQVAMKAATQRGDLEDANAINALKKSIEADYGKTYTPKKTSQAASVLGRWKLVYADKAVVYWTITSESVKRNDTPEVIGSPQFADRVMTVKWSNGTVDRATFEGDKFFSEGFVPGADLNDRPQGLVEGLREAKAANDR